MADPDKMDVLRDYTARYLNVQAYDLAQLKAYLDQPEQDAVADAYAEGLADTIAGEGLDIDTWESLTESEFEDGEAWMDHLEALYAYLFEDGPYLYGEEPALD